MTNCLRELLLKLQDYLSDLKYQLGQMFICNTLSTLHREAKEVVHNVLPLITHRISMQYPIITVTNITQMPFTSTK